MWLVAAAVSNAAHDDVHRSARTRSVGYDRCRCCGSRCLCRRSCRSTRAFGRRNSSSRSYYWSRLSGEVPPVPSRSPSLGAGRLQARPSADWLPVGSAACPAAGPHLCFALLPDVLSKPPTTSGSLSLTPDLQQHRTPCFRGDIEFMDTKSQ